MAKWFKELPVNLKNGADRLRSVSESGSQPRANKAALVLSVATRTPSCTSIHPKSSSPDAAGVGCLLSGRSRKNTAADPSRSGSSSPKDGKVWDGLLPGKSRRSPRADAHNPEQHRARKGSPSYISRLIRVDKLDKSPNFNGSSITSEEAAEALNPAPAKSHAVSEPPPGKRAKGANRHALGSTKSPKKITAVCFFWFVTLRHINYIFKTSLNYTNVFIFVVSTPR